jgi:hypothetical protein
MGYTPFLEDDGTVPVFALFDVSGNGTSELPALLCSLSSAFALQL